MKSLFCLFSLMVLNASAQDLFTGEISYKAIIGFKEDSIRIIVGDQHRRIEHAYEGGSYYYLYLNNEKVYYHVNVSKKQTVKLENFETMRLVDVKDESLKDTVILGYRCVPKKYEAKMEGIDRGGGRLFVINWYAHGLQWRHHGINHSDFWPVRDSMISLMHQVIVEPADKMSPTFSQVTLVAKEIKWYKPSDDLFKLPAGNQMVQFDSIKVEDIQLEDVKADEGTIVPPSSPVQPKKKKQQKGKAAAAFFRSTILIVGLPNSVAFNGRDICSIKA